MFNSCNIKTVNVVNEYYLEEKNDVLEPPDVISNVTFVPLETNDDFIIGKIRKILKDNNLYYVLDSQTKTFSYMTKRENRTKKYVT